MASTESRSNMATNMGKETHVSLVTSVEWDTVSEFGFVHLLSTFRTKFVIFHGPLEGQPIRRLVKLRPYTLAFRALLTRTSSSEVVSTSFLSPQSTPPSKLTPS